MYKQIIGLSAGIKSHLLPITGPHQMWWWCDFWPRSTHLELNFLKKRTSTDSSNICTRAHTQRSQTLSYHSPHQAFGKTNCDRYTPTTHTHTRASRMHTAWVWLAGVQEWQLCRVLSELDCDWQTLDRWTSGAFLNQRPSFTVTHTPTRTQTDANQWNRYCLTCKWNTLEICQTTHRNEKNTHLKHIYYVSH